MFLQYLLVHTLDPFGLSAFILASSVLGLFLQLVKRWTLPSSVARSPIQTALCRLPFENLG